MEGLGASGLVGGGGGGTHVWLVQGSTGFYLCVVFSFFCFVCVCTIVLFMCLFLCVFVLFMRLFCLYLYECTTKILCNCFVPTDITCI